MDIGDWSYGDLLDTAAGQRRRIAELEAALSQSMGDHVDTGRALRLARAENQRLRVALDRYRGQIDRFGTESAGEALQEQEK